MVYTSKSRRPIDQNSIREILAGAQALNARDEITGFLTARADHFLQVLEGSEESVRSCFARISLDRRHTLVTVRGEARAESRIFPDWKMGWVEETCPSNSTESIFNLFESANRGKAQIEPTSIEAMLRIFSKNAKIVD